jgi:hypothetical protein
VIAVIEKSYACPLLRFSLTYFKIPLHCPYSLSPLSICVALYVPVHRHKKSFSDFKCDYVHVLNKPRYPPSCLQRWWGPRSWWPPGPSTPPRLASCWYNIQCHWFWFSFIFPPLALWYYNILGTVCQRSVAAERPKSSLFSKLFRVNKSIFWMVLFQKLSSHQIDIIPIVSNSTSLCNRGPYFGPKTISLSPPPPLKHGFLPHPRYV